MAERKETPQPIRREQFFQIIDAQETRLLDQIRQLRMVRQDIINSEDANLGVRYFLNGGKATYETFVKPAIGFRRPR